MNFLMEESLNMILVLLFPCVSSLVYSWGLHNFVISRLKIIIIVPKYSCR